MSQISEFIGEMKFDFAALTQVVDDYTDKRIEVIAWTFMADVKNSNPLMEERPLMEDEEKEIVHLSGTQKPNNNNNKEKELEVGDEVVLIGKFVESK